MDSVVDLFPPPFDMGGVSALGAIYDAVRTCGLPRVTPDLLDVAEVARLLLVSITSASTQAGRRKGPGFARAPCASRVRGSWSYLPWPVTYVDALPD